MKRTFNRILLMKGGEVMSKKVKQESKQENEKEISLSEQAIKLINYMGLDQLRYKFYVIIAGGECQRWTLEEARKHLNASNVKRIKDIYHINDDDLKIILKIK